MLQIEIESREGVSIIRFCGRMVAGLDLEYLRVKGEEAKRAARSGLLADLSHVPAIGSTGIGMLVSLYTSMMNIGARFVMVAPGGRVLEVLELTRISTIIPIVPDMTAALAEFQKPSSFGISA
jgi:anti-anti-sigma factor